MRHGTPTEIRPCFVKDMSLSHGFDGNGCLISRVRIEQAPLGGPAYVKGCYIMLIGVTCYQMKRGGYEI